VGKTAVVEGLAQRIVMGDVPGGLKDKKIFSLDMGAMVAGAKYRGEFEERLKAVLEEVKKGNVLIVINGKEYPDLHSTEDAAKYMEANDIHFNVESWIVGGAVKEKYPNTDKKVVIEFSRSDKEK
jgi:hypothetical protein